MKCLLTSALVLISLSTTANAHHNKDYIKVRVVDTTPIYKYVRLKPSQASCHHTKQSNNHRNALALGSVIGGSIGHSISHRKHKVLGTIAGSIIGGTIAHKISHSKQSSHTAKHCYTQHNAPHKIRKLKGYEVTYKFRNNYYQTFSKNRPNKYIRIYK